MKNITITCLATGSTGNCYLIESPTSTIILEFGIDFDKVSPHLDYDKQIIGLYSHCHPDHYKSVEKIKIAGIPIYGIHNLKDGKKAICGEWSIVPISLPHSVDCFGYAIFNTTYKKNIFFATDCTQLPKFTDFTPDCLMIECNYSVERIIENKEYITNTGYLNHLSLEYVKWWLEETHEKQKNIMTIHKSSSGNITDTMIINELKEFTENLVIAKKNAKIVLNINGGTDES